MNRRSARVVPVVPAQEAAARPQVVAPPHRTRPIRVQGDAAEFADADEVAGGGVEEVGVGVRIPLRLHLLSPAGRPTVVGLPLVLGAKTIRGDLGLFQDLALEVGAEVKAEKIEERETLAPDRE